METKTLRISCAQLSFSVGAIQENKEKILSKLEEAEKISSDIVLFPELSLTGYPPEDLLWPTKAYNIPDISMPTVSVARKVFKKYKLNTSIGSDWLHPRHFGQLL